MLEVLLVSKASAWPVWLCTAYLMPALCAGDLVARWSRHHAAVLRSIAKDIPGAGCRSAT